MRTLQENYSSIYFCQILNKLGKMWVLDIEKKWTQVLIDVIRFKDTLYIVHGNNYDKWCIVQNSEMAV